MPDCVPAHPTEKEDKFLIARAGRETKEFLFILAHFYGVVAFLTITVGSVAIAAGQGKPVDLLFPLVIGLIVLAISLAICWAFAPAAYVLGREGMKIVRHFARPIVLPYVQIRNVRVVCYTTPPTPTPSWRLGSWPPGGLFAYFGRFKVDRLGWIRVYATSWKGDMVVVETDREPWYLSPAEPQKFCEALQARLR